MVNDFSFSEDGSNISPNNLNNVDNSQQGSFIEASFSTEDYSGLISAESVQLENSSLPNYVDDIPVHQNNHNNIENDAQRGEDVPIEDIQLEEEQVDPAIDMESRLRKQLILVHIFCIVMGILSIGLMFLEIFPAVLVCVIYLRDDLNQRTAKHDKLLLSLTVANFLVSLVSLLINVFVIFALCTFTFFLASILFVFILPYTFVFRFVSREMLLNRGYTTNNNIYPYNMNNGYPASPYIAPHVHHPHNIQLHQIHHHHQSLNSFHPYPHHSAHHMAHNHHPQQHHHHHSPHHHSGSLHSF